MKSLTLFNNKGGVGKTTLTFNIAHMLARKGYRTVALDYDPQCNLSAIFLSDEELAELWEEESSKDMTRADGTRTVAGCIDLIRRGKGDIRQPSLIPVADDLWLLPGHLALSRFEQQLAEEWPKIHGVNNERALDVTTALDLLSNLAAQQVSADIVIIDVGPSLGALNRAALLACDAVMVPLAPDLFSLQGLANVGPTLREWRHDWDNVYQNRLHHTAQEALPIHRFQPIGYIVQQHLSRADRIPAGYQRWAARVPWYFHHYVLGEADPPEDLSIENDDQCISLIKHFASLVPLAQNARKPIFDLKQADGIGGGQIQAVARARREFEALVTQLIGRLDQLPDAVSAADRAADADKPAHPGRKSKKSGSKRSSR
jgi:cellulose biosynthesis protein BcsQ